MKLSAFFTKSGIPHTGLSPTMKVWLPAGELIVDDGIMTEVGGGWYYYELGGFENEREYFARADAGATVPLPERFVFTVNQPIGGGGMALTGDIIFMLKKLTDNVSTKDEMKKFIADLIDRVKDSEDLHKNNSKSVSKLSVEMSKLIDENKELSSSVNKLGDKVNNVSYDVGVIEKGLKGELDISKFKESGSRFDQFISKFQESIVQQINIISQEVNTIKEDFNCFKEQMALSRNDDIETLRPDIVRVAKLATELAEINRKLQPTIRSAKLPKRDDIDEVMAQMKILGV